MKMWNLYTNKEVKKTFSKTKLVKKIQKEEALVWSFGISFGVTVETTDTKYGPLSKHLFQKTQHGGCKKPLANDEFVQK